MDKTQFLFRYEYFDENRRAGKGMVGWYVIKIDDPAQAASEIAAALDGQFANSQAETKTSTEKAFMQGFANQIGNIGMMLTMILSVVFFMILLVVANTMAQSVRERTSEIGVLKTLGFSDPVVLGARAERVSAHRGRRWLGDALPHVLLRRPRQFQHGHAAGVHLQAEFAVRRAWDSRCLLRHRVAGILPAVAAMRLKITDALRRA